MATVPISTVRKQFSAVIRCVEAGEEIKITRRGKPAARLVRRDSPVLGSENDRMAHHDGDSAVIGKQR